MIPAYALEPRVFNKHPKVFIVYGKDEWQQQHSINTINRYAKYYEFQNSSSFTVKNKNNINDIILSLEQYSLFSSKQSIKITLENPYCKIDNINSLLSQIYNLSHNNIFVVIAANLNSKHLSKLKKDDNTLLISCNRPSLNGLRQYINITANKYKLSISNTATDLLVTQHQGNINKLSQSLIQLKMLYQNGTEINEQNIANLEFEANEYNIFDLLDSIYKTNIKKIKKINDNFCINNGEWPLLLWWLCKEIRLCIKHLIENDKTNPKINALITKHSIKSLHHCLQLAFEVDKAIKGLIRTKPEILFRELCIQLALPQI